MQVMVEIPERLAAKLKGQGDFSRKVCEALAIEAYLAGELTRGQVGELLEMSFHELEEWFVRKGVPRNYGAEDLEEDRRTLGWILGQS